ncbi:uncharacterized protein LOC142046516 [Chelonoidis abingdonii]|uniref:uncharacterized protein LOC142046516 n=1 Tax=Chelonoidis abingdonii TaxID=106734 RepID=UPI003F4922D8
MGNVCGCVRAEKEEQSLDPAKAPLSPAKHSPGRKYFRRKTRKKSIEEGIESEQIKNNEEKIQNETRISKETEILSWGMALGDSFTWRMPVDSNVLPVNTDVSVDLVKEKALPSEARSDSFNEDSSSVVNQRFTKSDETDTWLNEQNKRTLQKDCTQKRKYLHDDNTRELIFQKKAGDFHFAKTASLNSVNHSKQCEEIGLNEVSFRVNGDVPERKSFEKSHQFLSETNIDPQFEQKGSHSSDAGFPQMLKEVAFYSIPPHRSKVNTF